MVVPTGSTRVAGVIGDPVRHSLSPALHNAAFAELGLDWTYLAFEVPVGRGADAVAAMRALGIEGLSVTMPHKDTVAAAVDELSPAAALLGAANCVRRDGDRLIGENTDGAGFLRSLRTQAGVDSAGLRTVVLGAGGAARAAVYGLIRAGAEVAIVNRTKSRAEALIKHLRVSAGIDGIRLMTLDQALEWGMSLIVNCTSAGLHPHVNQSPWRQSLPFPTGVTVYDMVYRPATTALMRQCVARGGRAIGGLGMLARQGALSFEIWTGVAPGWM